MKHLVMVLFLSMFSIGVQAAGGAAHPMDHIKTDLSDKESLQKGFALFSNYCFGCHSLEYARYELSLIHI